MNEYYQIFVEYISSLKDNEFFKGTLPAAVVAYLLIWGKKIPGYLLWTYRRFFRLSVEFHELEKNYDNVKYYINKKFSDSNCGSFINSKDIGNLPTNIRFFYYKGKLCSTRTSVKNHDNRQAGTSVISTTITVNLYGFRNAKYLRSLVKEGVTLIPKFPSRYLTFKGVKYKIGNIKTRPETSFYYENTQKIIQGLEKFYLSEERYAKLGIPYKMGILFSGPPGTGKTSMASVLATKFVSNVVIVNLSNITNEDLEYLFIHHYQKKDERYIYLFEDLDCSISTNRDTNILNNEQQVSLSTLLNILDGFLTPHGCVFVVTSNFSDKLDKALLRPGRIDKVYQFGNINEKNAQNMCKNLTNRNLTSEELKLVKVGMTPAELQQKLLLEI